MIEPWRFLFDKGSTRRDIDLYQTRFIWVILEYRRFSKIFTPPVSHIKPQKLVLVFKLVLKI